ncbi:hypothetical protein ABZ690_17750 [Streptomyces sp. NPDC006967]|uniref:hypothetical protein n=1 Tax=Streptomyces sp. NPDC006967 TaxID=3156906 RepID=UPI003402D3D6
MMTTHPPVIPGLMAREQRSLIRVPMAVPTVWMATADGLVCIDLIAVERAANGQRKGWSLTVDEAQYAASVMFGRRLPYSLIAKHVGVSAATLKAWFPEQAVPLDAGMARTGARKSSPTRVAKCGTRTGYGRHRRRGEAPCEACRAASAVADRHYRRHGTYVGAPGVVA